MSNVTLVKPTTILNAAPIVWVLIRAPKGPHNLIFIDGWETLSSSRHCAVRHQIKKVLRRMALPYVLHWRTWLCWWSFDYPELQAQREWFDINEAEGKYPEIASYHPERITA